MSSKKYVLIPLRVFQDLCTSTKKQGDKITGVVKEFTENESKKPTKKRYTLCLEIFDLYIFSAKTNQNARKKPRKERSPKNLNQIPTRSRAKRQPTQSTQMKVAEPPAQNSLPSDDTTFDDIYRDVKNPASYSSNVKVLV